MNNSFTIINSTILAELVKTSEDRLIIVSPGITNDVAIAIAQKANENKIKSIEVIIDSDPDAIRYGYGQIEAIKTLQNLNIKLRTQPGIRIGIIITDLVSLIFTPTPQNLEEEIKSLSAPNAIYLGKKQVEELLDSIITERAAKTDSGEVEIGQKEIKKEEIKNIENKLIERPPIKPDLERRMRVISSVFQFVDTEFKGARIFNNSFSLTGRDLGIKDTDLASRISARYQLFNNDQISELKNQFDLETVLNRIKDAYLKKIPNYGSVLHYKNTKEFTQAVEFFQEEIKKTKQNIETTFSEMLKKSRQELFSFISENLKRNFSQKELQNITKPFDLEKFIQKYLDKKMKSAANSISDISFTFKITNVSPQLINDESFRVGIERAFDQKFDDIVQIDSAVKATEEEI